MDPGVRKNDRKKQAYKEVGLHLAVEAAENIILTLHSFTPQLPFPSALEDPLHSISAEFSLAALPSNSLWRNKFRLLEKKQPLSSSPWLTHSYKVLRRGFPVTSCPATQEQSPLPGVPPRGHRVRNTAWLASRTQKIHSSLHTEKQAPGTIKQSNPFPNSPSLLQSPCNSKEFPGIVIFFYLPQKINVPSLLSPCNFDKTWSIGGGKREGGHGEEILCTSPWVSLGNLDPHIAFSKFFSICWDLQPCNSHSLFLGTGTF